MPIRTTNLPMRKSYFLIFCVVVACAEVVWTVLLEIQSSELAASIVEQEFHAPNQRIEMMASSKDKSLRRTIDNVVFPIFNANLRHLDNGNFTPDYGELDYYRLNNTKGRLIRRNDSLVFEIEREEYVEEMSNQDKRLRPRKVYTDEDLEDDPPDGCYRNNWKSKFHPTCNNFHDQNMLEGVLDSLLVFRGQATFRSAWSHHTSPQLSEESFSPGDWVIKTIRLNWMNGLPRMVEMQREAVVLDVLSASPRIIDIYGFCGQDSIVENMPHEVDEEIHTDMSRRAVRKAYENIGTQFPVNTLTSLQVVDLALTMAESLADLHGFAGGVIVQGDTHTAQWLRNADGVVKLNDFNNGFIMDWSYENQNYCLEKHSFAGSFFAPEVQLGKHIANERVDIYGYGCTLYTILTGNYPYFEVNDSKERNRMISDNELADIHDIYKVNGTVDAELVKLIYKTWKYNPRARPSIFEIVDKLRDIKKRLLNKEFILRRKGDPKYK